MLLSTTEFLRGQLARVAIPLTGWAGGLAAALLLGLATSPNAPAPVAGPAQLHSTGLHQPAALCPAVLPWPGQRAAAARAHVQLAAPVPADTSARGMAAVWADLHRRAYFLEADAQAPTTRVASNLRQHLSARLAPAHYTLAAAVPPARLQSGQGPAAATAPASPAWQVGIYLRGIGRGKALPFQPAARPTLAASTDTSVRYQHGAAFAVEYVNTPAGVRQNYYLAQRPGGGSGPVQVALALATALRPVASPDGQAVDFVPASGGAAVLHYAGLRAWDATGRALPARLRLSSATALALEVNDAGATYPLTIDPLASTPTNTLTDPLGTAGDNFGYSVAGAGDVNGDGYADVVIGAYGTPVGGVYYVGKSYLYLGSAAGLGTSVGTTAGTYQVLADPLNTGVDNFGYSVAGAGDVNGDGYGDLIVGAYGATVGTAGYVGKSHLYLGSPSAVLALPGLSLADPALSTDYYGTSVASAGDLNSDGYADVVITAPYTASGGISRGSAYIYLGSATGLGTTPGNGAGQYRRLDDPGLNDYDYYGNSAAGVGDINGDGYADVAIGASGTGNGGGYRGSIYIYYGSATGVGTTLGASAGQYQRFNDPPNLDNDSFGTSVAGAGDLNGDGYADLVTSAPNTYNNGSRRGTIYVYYGSAAGLSATAGTSAGQVLRINDPANADYDQFGWNVAGAGDVNGDGYADMLVGVPYSAGGGSKRGTTYVYLGSATGVSTTLGASAGQYQALNDPNGADYDYCGASVAGAGDINGDGYADVVVGAYGTDNTGNERGSAYLYLGSATGLGTTAGTSAGQYQRFDDPTNADYDYFGISVAGAGDVNGDGYADLLIAAYGTANGGISRGSTYLYLGSSTGLGTLLGAGAGQYQRLNDPANTNYDNFGNSVAGAGDVNGDGYADLVIGAANGVNGGSTYVYRGNQGDARPGRLRLLNTDLLTPLSASNKTAAQFGLGLTTRSVQGRVRARLVWEVATNGAGFLHTPSLTNSVQYSGRGPWTNLPVAGTELKQLVSKAGHTTRVRARLEYATASPLAGTSPPMGTGGVGSATRYGPWQYVTAQQLASLGALPLPVRPTAAAGANGLTLYPNPTSGRATLSGTSSGAAVQVLDALGRVVATATAGAEGTASLPAGLAPGVYVVRAGTSTVRLVVD